jgi:tetratricopeptide (TPR) repeat protein
LYRIRLGWGAALRRLGRERQAWQVLREAAELSLLAGDAVAAADALLVMTHDAIWIWRDYGTHLPDAIDLYERVMDALPADQELLSAQLSCALAIETYYQPDDPGRSVALATDAVRMARRVGSPDELLDVLLLAHAAFERPELAQLRLSVATEAAALAERLGDRTRAARALCSRGCDRIGLGRYAEGDDDLRRAWELARAQRALPVMVVIGWARALLTSMSGDFAAGRAADADAAELHRLVEMTGGDLSVLHDWNRCWLQGRWQDAEPVLRNALSVAPSAGLRELHALTLVAAGRLPAAKASVGSWSEQPSPREDYLWLPTMVGRARLWSALGDDRAVAELRIALQPYLGELVIGGTGVVYLGLVDEAIGILAVAAGDLDQAVDHLRRSVRRYEEMGVLPSAAFASRRLSEVLRRSGMPADSTEVLALERRAAEIADRLDIDLPVASGCSGC